MYKINLSQAKLKELKRLKQNIRDKKIFRRLQAIELRHQGKSNQEIANVTGVCKDTVMDWVKLYFNQGFSGLCKLNYDNRKQSKLDPYLDQIKQDLKDNIISTLAELQAWLKDKYGIELEQSWLSRCCKKKLIIVTKKHVKSQVVPLAGISR